MVKSRSTSYWGRKAGKDPCDIGYLLETTVHKKAIRAFLGDEVGAELVRALREVPPSLVSFAEEMAR